MSKEFRRRLPLVGFELPCLPRCEDGDDAGPVVRLELLWGVNQDESEGALGVDGGEEAGDVENVGSGAGGVGGGVGTAVKEGTDVAHTEERRSRRGKKDDGVGATAVLLGVARRESGGGAGGGDSRDGRCRCGGLLTVFHENLRSLADVREILCSGSQSPSILHQRTIWKIAPLV